MTEQLAKTPFFCAWRYHAFLTTADPTILDTFAADTTHRPHLPSWMFTANAAWLVLAVIAFNIRRARLGDCPRPGKSGDYPPWTGHSAGTNGDL